MSTDLHAALQNAITAAVAEHIALHDPAGAIRRYERDLKVLERHADDGNGQCQYCIGSSGYAPDWPCDDIRDLFDVYPEVSRGV